MRSAWLRILPVICLSLAGAGPVRAQEVSVTGLAIEASEREERLVIRADGELSFDVSHPNDRLMLLLLRGVGLAEGVPRRLSGGAGATLQRVVAVPGSADRPNELRLQIRHLAGLRPLVRRLDEGAEVVFAPQGAAPLVTTPAVPATTGERPTLSLAYRNAPLTDLIRRIATQSGETIVMEADIPKRISIIGPQRYTLDEARALLETALLLHGYVAVPMPGGGRKILPISGAPLPWVEAIGESPGDEPVTTLVRLEAIDAEFMLRAIQPLIGSDVVAVVEGSSNGILLAGSARKVSRLRDAMGLLDDRGTRQQVIWKVQHRQASEVLTLLEDGFPDELLKGQADDRTNRLILEARAEHLADLRRFVSRLDRPPVGGGDLHVLRIRNADAEALAAQIRGLAQASPGADEFEAPLSARSFSLEVDSGTRSLVLRADPVTAQIIADLVAELDIQAPRVRVGVTVAEVTTSDSLRLGFDSFIPISTPNDLGDTIAVISTNPSGGGIPNFAGPDRSFVTRVTRDPVVLPIVDAFGNPVEVSRGSFAISADDRAFTSQILLSPELLVTSGEEQEIFTGNNIPVRVQETETDATGGPSLQNRQDIERRDTGVLLRVQPTVGAEGGVRMEVLVELSSLAPSLAGDVERVGQTFANRRIEAVVQLSSGNVAVLAFAAEPVESFVMRSVPYLASIPILGQFFRTTDKTTSTRSLLAVIRAVIEREEAVSLTAILEEHLLEIESAASAPAAAADG